MGRLRARHGRIDRDEVGCRNGAEVQRLLVTATKGDAGWIVKVTPFATNDQFPSDLLWPIGSQDGVQVSGYEVLHDDFIPA